MQDFNFFWKKTWKNNKEKLQLTHVLSMVIIFSFSANAHVSSFTWALVVIWIVILNKPYSVFFIFATEFIKFIATVITSIIIKQARASNSINELWRNERRLNSLKKESKTQKELKKKINIRLTVLRMKLNYKRN